MRDFFQGIKHIFSYHRNNRSKINETNLSRLNMTIIISFIITVFCYIITPLLIPNWRLTIEYIILVPIYVVFYIASMVITKKKADNYKFIQLVCALYCMCMMAAFIAISTVTYTEGPDIFVGFWIMVIPVLFILNPFLNLFVEATGSIVFIILVLARKGAVAVEHDIFSTMVAFMLSLAIYIITSQLRNSEAKERKWLYELSITDGLTGLFNKKSFEELCKEFRYGRSSCGTHAFCIVDIDDFKVVNDTYGHYKGDEVLRVISSCLKSSTEPDDMIGRIGGDEFGMLIRTDHSINRLETIFKEINENFSYQTKKILGEKFTLCIGAVVLPSIDYEYSRMYELADIELYKCKNSGKSKFSIIKYNEEKSDSKNKK